jgi:NADPH-dependent ferric siderophore reductase
VDHVRREPPRFRRVKVDRVERESPRLVRVTFVGPDLDGLSIEDPAASVRLLLPLDGALEPVTPMWNGNEFLLPDGSRPLIRTFTPRRVDPATRELDVEIVMHGSGAASDWASTTEPGRVAAIAGPGRGYAVDRDAAAFILAGDETAIPAISQLLEVLPESADVQVRIEITDAFAEVELPEHPHAAVEWRVLPAGGPPGEALVAAMLEMEIPAGARVWAAGEAAAVQRIRTNLFKERGFPREQAVVRGYWKTGRNAGGEPGKEGTGA